MLTHLLRNSRAKGKQENNNNQQDLQDLAKRSGAGNNSELRVPNSELKILFVVCEKFRIFAPLKKVGSVTESYHFD